MKRRAYISNAAIAAQDHPGQETQMPDTQTHRIVTSAAFLLALIIMATATSESANAQITIQLPTINMFSVNTVVSVPDGGTISLGGVNSHSSGRTSRGVPGLSSIPLVGRGFGNSGIGSDTTSNQATVKATIINLKEMEDELLSGIGGQGPAVGISGAKGGKSAAETRKKAAFLSRHMGKSFGKSRGR